MKRIDTSTVEEDKFGTGRDGFTNGSPGVTPPTQLDETWFDHAQEELARAIEGSGQTLDDTNYNQLDDAVHFSTLCSPNAACYVLSGLDVEEDVNLDVIIGAGKIVFAAPGEPQARIYDITEAKLEAVLGAGRIITLDDDSDNYLYFAAEDPGAITGNRETIYITFVSVANGAAQPFTPAGTRLFARVVTGSGNINTIERFRRGPLLVNEGQGGIACRDAPDGTAAEVVPYAPSSVDVDLGTGLTIMDGGGTVRTRKHFRNVRARRLFLSDQTVTPDTDANQAMFWTEPFSDTTTPAGTTQRTLLNENSYPDGTVVTLFIRVSAFSTTDPTDGYSCIYAAHAHIDGGTTWDLDGGLVKLFEDGNGAIASGVSFDITASGSLLRASLTGHATDTMRWFYVIDFTLNGNG